MNKTKKIEAYSEEISLITQKMGVLSESIGFIYPMIDERGIAGIIELWHDYADDIYNLILKLEDDFEEFSKTNSNNLKLEGVTA